MKSRITFLVACIVASWAGHAFSQIQEAPKIGVFFQPPRESILDHDVEYKINLSKLVGANYIRLNGSNLNFNEGALSQLEKAQKAGLKVVYHLCNRIRRDPSQAPQDMEAYKAQVRNMLAQFKPDLLVIENEETAPKFYAGTAGDYLKQLSAAAEVAHAMGVKITNGGLTTAQYNLIQYYQDHGRKDKAQNLAARVLRPNQARRLAAGAPSPEQAAIIENGRKLIEGFRTAPIDYVNFHWYVNDPAALEEVVTYLQSATGKPAITTEMGQYDTAPETVARLMTKAYQLRLPYIIWYSGDATRALGLQESDTKLRPNGEYFRHFLQQVNK